jgi:multiple sugar transport system permease protein
MATLANTARVRKRPRKPARRILLDTVRWTVVYGLLLIIGAAILLPFIWTVSSSLKPYGSGISFPPEFIPRQIKLENYVNVTRAIPFFLYLRNSVIVTGLAMTGELVSASLVAYAFARLRFPGRNFLFLLVLATMMIPYPVTMVPSFILFHLLGWVNTFAPLVVPPFFGPAYSIFLLRQFFMTINHELDEAAEVDGASWFRIYWQIILPLAKPALATVAIFAFMAYWNDFMGPLIYLSKNEMFTLALGVNYLRSMRGGGDFSVQMAGSVMFVTPCIVLFAVAQRYIVQGIVTTGLKG